jgi:acyl dehydratase
VTPTAAYRHLSNLVGREFGPGDWIAVTVEKAELFALATGAKEVRVQPYLILSLLPALVTSVVVPIAAPRMSVNYGLDRFRSLGAVQSGDRLRARMRLVSVDEITGGLAVKRSVVVENQDGQPVLEAETISHLVF